MEIELTGGDFGGTTVTVDNAAAGMQIEKTTETTVFTYELRPSWGTFIGVLVGTRDAAPPAPPAA